MALSEDEELVQFDDPQQADEEEEDNDEIQAAEEETASYKPVFPQARVVCFLHNFCLENHHETRCRCLCHCSR